MTNPTATPWRVGKVDRETQTVEIDAPHGHRGDGLNYSQWTAFAECVGADDQPDEGIVVAEANARHIVHCVNNYERLVEALREVVESGVTITYDPHEMFARQHEAHQKARTILAQLEAGKGG